MGNIECNNIFSDRIRELRINKKKVTQKDFASHLGIQTGSYAGYENAGVYPSVSKLIEIADFLDVSIDYLLGRETHPNLISQNQYLENIISNNLEAPLWIRICSNNLILDYTWPIYHFDNETSIEFFDPLEERAKSGFKRIYLDFVNTEVIEPREGASRKDYKNDQLNNLFNFFLKYGFLGKLPSMQDYPGVQRRRNLIEIINESNLGFFKDMQYFSLLHTKSIRQIEKSLREPELLMGYDDYNLLRLNTYSSEQLKENPLLSKDRYINGYFETLENAAKEINILFDILDSLPKYKCLDQINYYLSDIITTFVEKDDQIFQTIGYQSLLGLMYYELMLDIKNESYPVKCNKCTTFFIPDSKEQHTCFKCLDKDSKGEF